MSVNMATNTILIKEGIYGDIEWKIGENHDI